MTPVEEIRRAAQLMRERERARHAKAWAAVADLLDYAADHEDAWGDEQAGFELAIARAYLGGAP